MKQYVFFLIVVPALWGCDPLRRIEMKNQSGQPATITWTIKKDSILSSPFFISSAEDVQFALHPQAPYNRVYMSFGVGLWTLKDLQNLVDDLDSVVIRWQEKEIRLTSEQDMKDYLVPRRRGIGKRKILIVINNDTQADSLSAQSARSNATGLSRKPF